MFGPGCLQLMCFEHVAPDLLNKTSTLPVHLPSGGRSWHGLPWVNSCAFWEWATLMLLFVSMLAGATGLV